MAGIVGPNTAADGMIVCLDVSNQRSYSSSVNYLKNTAAPTGNSDLNSTNPVPWSAGTFTFYNESSPTSIYFKNASAGGSYLGFTLLNKKVLSWKTYEVGYNLEVMTGSAVIYMGSSGGGYSEGPQVSYNSGSYVVSNKIFHTSNIYSHEANNLQFSVSTGVVGGEARLTNLTVKERLYDGIFVNGVAYNSNNLGSIYFDGTNDFMPVGFGKNVNPYNTPFSLSFWTKPSSTAANVILASTGQSRGLADTAQRFYISIYGGKWDYGIMGSTWSGGTVNADTNWNLITITASPAGVLFYLNGVLIYTKVIDNTYVLNDSFWFGTHDNGYYYTGYMSQIYLYNRALSSQEILQNYNATKGRFGL